ncbi:hypothetical protein GCK32_002174, partial [Trichostrongylus colubriformis]
LMREFADEFAVSGHELTQTDLVQRDIDTGDARPIKQKDRPVPPGVQSVSRAPLPADASLRSHRQIGHPLSTSYKRRAKH